MEHEEKSHHSVSEMKSEAAAVPTKKAYKPRKPKTLPDKIRIVADVKAQVVMNVTTKGCGDTEEEVAAFWAGYFSCNPAAVFSHGEMLRMEAKATAKLDSEKVQ